MNLQLYDFGNNWHTEIKPILFHKDVQTALNNAMDELAAKIQIRTDTASPEWKQGSPPYLWTLNDFWIGRLDPESHSLDWYRVKNECWTMAPFCVALGKQVFPDLKWKVKKSRRHATAVGFRRNEPVMIMDILLFERMNAQEIYDFADSSLTNAEYSTRYGVDLKKWDRLLRDYPKYGRFQRPRYA